MRLSNRSKAGLYSFMDTSLLMLLVLGVIAFFVEKYRIDILGWELPADLGSVAAAVGFLHLRAPDF